MSTISCSSRPWRHTWPRLFPLGGAGRHEAWRHVTWLWRHRNGDTMTMTMTLLMKLIQTRLSTRARCSLDHIERTASCVHADALAHLLQVQICGRMWTVVDRLWNEVVVSFSFFFQSLSLPVKWKRILKRYMYCHDLFNKLCLSEQSVVFAAARTRIQQPKRPWLSLLSSGVSLCVSFHGKSWKDYGKFLYISFYLHFAVFISVSATVHYGCAFDTPNKYYLLTYKL